MVTLHLGIGLHGCIQLSGNWSCRSDSYLYRAANGWLTWTGVDDSTWAWMAGAAVTKGAPPAIGTEAAIKGSCISFL